jgi:hypothetical protein
MLAAAQIAELNPAEIMRHVQQLQQYAVRPRALPSSSLLLPVCGVVRLLSV